MKKTSILLVAILALASCKSSKVPEVDTPDNISSNISGQGPELEFTFTRGEAHNHPLMAVWIEDENGEYIQTLFIAESLGQGIFGHGDASTGKWLPGEIRRPAALPVWSHSRGIKEADGLYVPTSKTPVPDAYTGATPPGSFILNTRLDQPGPDRFFVLFEINQTWDWNEFWHNNKYPDNEQYKTSCQPSLIYRAEVDLKDDISEYNLELIGRGHHAGENGEVYTDLETMSTALNITREVSVKVMR